MIMVEYGVVPAVVFDKSFGLAAGPNSFYSGDELDELLRNDYEVRSARHAA